jgi:hypothetical protein
VTFGNCRPRYFEAIFNCFFEEINQREKLRIHLFNHCAPHGSGSVTGGISALVLFAIAYEHLLFELSLEVQHLQILDPLKLLRRFPQKHCRLERGVAQKLND